MRLADLVDVRTEELLAFELDVGEISGLGTRDGDFPPELDPGHSQDAAAVAARECARVLLPVVQQAQLALTNVVHGNLQSSLSAWARNEIGTLKMSYRHSQKT